jgi:hypothetical protein
MKTRTRKLILGLGLATTALLALPLTSSGLRVAGVNVDQLTGGATSSINADVLSQQSNAVPAQQSSSSSSSSSTSSSSTKGGLPTVPPGYKPPLHGTDPHGTGTVATIDLPPTNTEPEPGNPAGPELLVVGRPEGSQNPDGTYHGHITIAALAGTELLGVDTTEGHTAHSQLDPINSMLLGQICSASGNQICLNAITADSATTPDGSTNHFEVLGAHVGGASGINADVATADGNISDNGSCQTSGGDSNVATATVGGAINADALNSSSVSQACNNGTPPSTTQTSNAINLNGVTVPVPPPAGCANGTPNTVFTLLPPLNVIDTVCNADDPGTTQAGVPYGVREALTVFGDLLGTGVLKATTAAAETRAVAPPVAPGSPNIAPNNGNPFIGPGGGNKGKKNNGGNGGGNGGGSGVGASAAAGGGSLPFTGANLIWLAMLGLGLMAAGLAGAAVTPVVQRPRLDA